MKITIAIAACILLLAGCNYGEWTGRNLQSLSNVEIAKVEAESAIAVATVQANAQIATTRMWSNVIPLMIALFLASVIIGMLVAYFGQWRVERERTTQMAIKYNVNPQMVDASTQIGSIEPYFTDDGRIIHVRQNSQMTTQKKQIARK